mmetsp:Transcript_68208/g.101353  ORF Transcript_68208/g.101353 Transcript_68208/m.101353 type:complete len:81 (-) Transcript_68208:887-1129(-)
MYRMEISTFSCFEGCRVGYVDLNAKKNTLYCTKYPKSEGNLTRLGKVWTHSFLQSNKEKAIHTILEGDACGEIGGSNILC